MPLPKTASIAARATEVYSDVWSMLLQKCWGLDQGKEEQEMADLSLLLPYLRQLLTCCACAGLLEDAMISLVCGHCYCYECQFRAPLLKIQCRQCRERRGLVIETQIRLLVNCYKRMCLILASELHDNPLVLTIVEEEAPAKSGTNEKEAPESVENVRKETTDDGDAEVKDDKLANTAETFNPIAEILKEVQEGTKVSRAVLVIKPPSRYINARQMPTPKKDQSVGAKVAAAANSAPEKESENKSPADALTGGGGCGGAKKKRGRKAKRQLTLTLPSEEKESSENEKESSKSKVVKDKEKRDKGEKKDKGEKRDKGEKSMEPPPPTSVAVNVMEYDLLKSKATVDNLKPVELEVSARSVDSQFIKITSGGIVVKNKVKERETEKRKEYLSEMTPAILSLVRFTLDKDGNRRRVWNPLCPRVVVKRSRASIDKMRNLQTRTVGARLRLKEKKKKKAETPPLGTPTGKEGKKSQQTEPLPPQREEEMEVAHESRLEQLEREHGLQLPDLDASLDPDLELDASWLEELCEGIDEELMYFTQPPVPPPPPLPFAPSSTPPHHHSMFGPPYSPQHHLPPPHHFSPHHPPPPGFMHHPLPPPHPHHFIPRHHPLPPPPPPRIPQRPPMPPTRPPPIRIHSPTTPQSPIFPFRSKHQLPVIVGKMNVGKNPVYNPKPLLSPGQSQSSKAKKRRSPGYSESGWRCRCGTNNVMFPEKVCAKGKCPCYSKGIPCKNCLCRKCHNPFNNEDEDEEEMQGTDQLDPDLDMDGAKQQMELIM